MIPLLTKYELNKYFKEIKKEDNENYLILKLAYIYGKNVDEILTIQKKNINLKENTITIPARIEQTYPIAEELKQELKEHINNITTQQHIFKLHDEEKYNTYLNEFVKKVNRRIYREYQIKIPHFTVREFKRLRGQHLILDGATFNTIRKFYGNSNTKITQSFLQLEDLLIDNNKPVDKDDIINNFTDTNIYYDNEFKIKQILIFVNGDKHTKTDPYSYKNYIELNLETMNTKYETHDKIIDDIINNTPQIKEQLSKLKVGEYRKYNNLRFTRIS